MPIQLGTGDAGYPMREEKWRDRRQIMPVNVVKTAEDEIAWERAKEAARKQYPDITGPRFYRIVMTIFKKMTHREDAVPPMARRRRRASLG
jgi:hypothetical protein